MITLKTDVVVLRTKRACWQIRCEHRHIEEQLIRNLAKPARWISALLPGLMQALNPDPFLMVHWRSVTNEVWYTLSGRGTFVKPGFHRACARSLLNAVGNATAGLLRALKLRRVVFFSDIH